MSSKAEGPVVQSGLLARRRFLLEWVAVHLLVSLCFAALIILFQDAPLLILALGGLPLGFSQHLTLRRYVSQDTTEYWTLSTAAAWFGAMCFFVVYTFAVEAGSGINATPDEQIRSLLIWGGILSGALFGGLQYLGISLRLWRPFVWVLLQSFAWTVGWLTAAYFSPTLFGDGFLPHLPASHPFEGIVSTGVGMCAGLAVYGLVLGTGIAWSLPQLRQPQG